MRKIGVISDTHGLLRPEVKEHLESCDVILHVGDINEPELLDELRMIAPVCAVCGNADESWAEAEGLSQTVRVNVFGLNIFMAHMKKTVRDGAAGCDIILTGHTHKYEEKKIKDQLWLNPGTCGPRRRSQAVTMAVIETEGDGVFSVNRIDISRSEDKKSTDEKTAKKSSDKASKKSSDKDVKKSSDRSEKKKNSRKKEPVITVEIVQGVISDVNAGTTAAGIAERRGISEEAVVQIGTLYVSHQGISAEGVLELLK